MKQPFIITELDRRYTGHEDFKVALEFTSSFSDWQIGKSPWITATAPTRRFLEYRNWFWRTYGPSAEINIWLKLKWIHSDPAFLSKEYDTPVVTEWAYSDQNNQLRLYLKDDSILSFFLLANPIDK